MLLYSTRECYSKYCIRLTVFILKIFLELTFARNRQFLKINQVSNKESRKTTKQQEAENQFHSQPQKLDIELEESFQVKSYSMTRSILYIYLFPAELIVNRKSKSQEFDFMLVLLISGRNYLLVILNKRFLGNLENI